MSIADLHDKWVPRRTPAVEALIAAARGRVARGHDEHCAYVDGAGIRESCSCGHEDLGAALAAVEKEGA